MKMYVFKLESDKKRTLRFTLHPEYTVTKPRRNEQPNGFITFLAHSKLKTLQLIIDVYILCKMLYFESSFM